MASKIDWKKLAVKALHFLVNEGEKEVKTAVRKALENAGIHPSQVSLEQYDDLKNTVQTLHDALTVEV